MKLAEVEKHLLSMPHATLVVQWGDSRVFKVGGKMFAVIGFNDEKSTQSLCFKTSEDSFQILKEIPGIKPAPYLARAHWIWMDSPKRLPVKDLKAYLTRAHALVAGKLTKKTQRALGLAG